MKGLYLLLIFAALKYWGDAQSENECYNSNGDAIRCEPLQQSFSFEQLPMTNSTCGSPPSEFCFRSLSLGNIVSDCSRVCDANDPSNAHPPRLMTDFILNEESWWQSENNVEIVQIDLSLQTMVEISVISFNFVSLKPASFYLERSVDNGQSYQPFHFFATSCDARFSIDPEINLAFENETAALCQTIGTPPVPGQISFFTTLERPSANDSIPGYSERLYSFITATNIRVTLDRFFVIEDIEPDDLGYYYAIEDLNVIGSCQCHGHASSCTLVGGEYQCQCEHNTAGMLCEVCDDFFHDVPWQRSDGNNQFECQPCNCNNHSMECLFDLEVYEASGMTSGGVCINCQNNTAGNHCEECAEFYYRRPNRNVTDEDVCTPCQCDFRGVTNNGDCARVAAAEITVGSCFCKDNVEGQNCDLCRPGFFNLTAINLDGCDACDCNATGSESSICDETGTCSCRPNVVGKKCDTCRPGYYQVTSNDTEGCRPCNCNAGGALGSECDMLTGQCRCKQGIFGLTCSETIPGFYFPTIDSLRLEAELAVGDSSALVQLEGEGMTFTGFGFYRVTEQTSSIDLGSITPPVSGEYEVLFRYNLEDILIWNSTTLSITTSEDEGNGPAMCDDIPELSVGESSFQYTNWAFGIGLTISRDFCLRGGRSYSFQLSGFDSGINSDTVALDIDSLVVILISSSAVAPLSDPTTSMEYLSCVDDWRSLISQPFANPACEDITFIVSTAVLNGTLECECDATGSVQLECTAFGGQCACRSGVRGRTCDECRPAFFGFSSSGCSSCNCNSTGSTSIICESDNGSCPCHTNVVDRDCSSCAVNHWDFGMGVGCTECQCNITGSESQQCDLYSGTCNCKAGVIGDSCDRCSDGHFGFSDEGCSPCNCSTIGAVSDTCDEDSGQCICKDLTTGRDCSQCTTGTFNLQQTNPAGCQPCFCSGLSTECSHAEGFVSSTISTTFDSNGSDILSEWTVIPANSVAVVATSSGEGVYIIANTDSYLSAPSTFLGNQLSSYGQFLRLSLESTTPNILTTSEYDVILSGGGTNITSRFSIYTSSGSTFLQVQLLPTGMWVDIDTNESISSSVLQSVLSSLDRLLITASYSTNVTLLSIELDTASPSSIASGTPVSWVEQCVCPLNYSGLSCELCAPGYTRRDSGYCELCECNGFSTTCNPDTGECTNCSELTDGVSCERCTDGTYGNPLNGTACQACPCPFTDGIGQFTEDCALLDSGEIMCFNCPTGHTGLRCESCIDGYFGDPMGILSGTPSSCSDCLCNGNIIAATPGSCDTVTGTCLLCLDNTTGDNCERCQDGFYGDAIEAKNCTACACHPTGSADPMCDQMTGQCNCLPNVTGLKCDACISSHYNIGSSAGCMPCQCDAIGSQSSECDIQSGECNCEPGVAGPFCDQCSEGYYGFSADGCTACSCSLLNSLSESCGDDGQCICETGAGGPNCQCLPNYFQSSDGCEACPQCYQELEGAVNAAREFLEATESQVSNTTAQTVPFESRFQVSQSAVQGTVYKASNATARNEMLLNRLSELTVLLDNTLSTQLLRINSSITILKAASTPIFVLASTSEELANRTVEELVQVSAIVESIMTVTLPQIADLASSIQGYINGVHSNTEQLMMVLSLCNSQLQLLENLTSEIEQSSLRTLSLAINIQQLEGSIQSILPTLLGQTVALDVQVNNLNMQIVLLINEISTTMLFIDSIYERVPSVPSMDELSTLYENLNATLSYSQALGSQVSLQNITLSELINMTYETQQQIDELQQSLAMLIAQENTITSQAMYTYDFLQSKVNEVEIAIEYAQTILTNLTNFQNFSAEVAALADIALAAVPTNTTRDTLAMAESIMQSVVELSRNVSLAKSIAAEAEETFQQAEQVILQANTDELVQIVGDSMESITQLLEEANRHMDNASSIHGQLLAQSTSINTLEQVVSNSSNLVTVTEDLSEEADELVDNLLMKFRQLPTDVTTQLESVRSFVYTIDTEIATANISYVVDVLKSEVENQRSERQTLEMAIINLQSEVDRLKQLALSLPQNCN